MTTLINHGEMGGDTPMLQCLMCSVTFGIFWNYDGLTERIEYCPFCGEPVEDVLDETTN